MPLGSLSGPGLVAALGWCVDDFYVELPVTPEAQLRVALDILEGPDEPIATEQEKSRAKNAAIAIRKELEKRSGGEWDSRVAVKRLDGVG